MCNKDYNLFLTSGAVPIITLIITLLLCGIRPISRYDLGAMGSLTCERSLLRAVRLKARQALAYLQKRRLGRIYKSPSPNLHQRKFENLIWWTIIGRKKEAISGQV